MKTEDPETLLAEEWKLRCQQLERRLKIISCGLQTLAYSTNPRLTDGERGKFVALLIAAERLDEKQVTNQSVVEDINIFKSHFGPYILTGSTETPNARL